MSRVHPTAIVEDGVEIGRYGLGGDPPGGRFPPRARQPGALAGVNQSSSARRQDHVDGLPGLDDEDGQRWPADSSAVEQAERFFD